MRIRKKLVVLHTIFSLALALVLLLALRPAINQLVEGAELDESANILATALHRQDLPFDPSLLNRPGLSLLRGSPEELDLPEPVAAEALAFPYRAVPTRRSALGPASVAYLPPTGSHPPEFVLLATRNEPARTASVRVYWLVAIALLAAYALVAVALELFVLPQNVYAPIRRMLLAEQAVQEGRKGEELIPDSTIPADELGEIMRSRNESVVKLRSQETQLAVALNRIEEVANDLKRKNYLLETAQRNLAGAERLASLGMMSAGIAHELNTPLAVLKGLVETLHADPAAGVPPEQAALMLRVVGRLERLGEGLLDVARARPPRSSVLPLRHLVQEAITLVRLDRESASPRALEIVNSIPEDANLNADPDRLLQAFVNLIRNAVDALTAPVARADAPLTPGASTNSVSAVSSGSGGVAPPSGATPPPHQGIIEIACTRFCRDARDWLSVTITDNGPGIDAQILPRLFEPFATTRLDSRGTGLGLAVTDGIVREHGGLLLARNRSGRSGAVFEITLPAPAAPPLPAPAAP